MAENQGRWKKALLGLFILLALVGIIIGAIAGSMPEKFGKAKHASTEQAKPDVATSKTVEEPSAVTPQEPVKEQQQQQSSSSGTIGSTGSTPPASTITTKPVTKPTSPLVVIPSTNNAAAGTTGGNVLKGAVSQVLNNQATSGVATNVKLPTGVTGDQAVALVNSVVRSEFQNLASNGGTCTSTDGPEFIANMKDPDCIIITLLPGVVYDVGEDEFDVTTRKVIVGNPLNLPTLDGQNTPRIFHVRAGGYLDLRYVRTYRGGGELIATIPVLRGGTVLVELGGTGTFLGVIFTNADPPNPAILIAPNLSRAVRVFGGQIFVAGGVVTVTLCHFWVMQPGVLLREVYIFGAEILVGAGVAVVSGSTFTNSQIFLNVLGSAAFIAQLGGTLVCTGVTFTLNTGVIHASGAGILTFLGGGVAIFSAVTWNANLGALAHFGTGIFFFNGGGVLIISGSAQSAELGVAIACGAGGFQTNGGGVTVYSGVAQAFTSGASFLAYAGVLNWMGGGSFTATGVSISRVIGVASIYGVGGSFGSGGGTSVVVGCPSADVYGSVSAALVGGDIFLGVGILIDIGNPFFKVVASGFLALPGIHSFVGAGALVNYGTPVGLALTSGVYVAPGSEVLIVNGKAGTPNAFSARRLANASSTVVDAFPADAAAAFTLLNPTTFKTDVDPAVAQRLKDITGSSTLKKLDDIAMVKLDGDTNCNICGDFAGLAKTITGDSAGRCSNDQSKCTVATALTTTGQPMPSWISDVTKLHGTGKLLDTTIVSSVFKVGCNAAAADAKLTSCTDPSTVRDVVKDGLGDDCAQVQVSPRKLPDVPELANMDNTIAEALPDSDITTVFDVAFTSHNPECTSKVQAYLANHKLDTSSMADTFNQLTTESAVVNDATVQYLTTHVAKGMDMSTAAKNVAPNAVSAGGVSLTPTVLVSAEHRLAQPSFAKGDTATLALTNFLEGKDVKLGFTTDCTLTTPVTPITTTKFTDGADNNSQMLMDVPLASAPLNGASTKLAFVAEQAGIRWCSQPFIVNQSS